MKNLLMIAIALVTLNATAQEEKKEAHKGEMKERREMRKDMAQDMTPAEVAEIQTKKMTLHLDLTEKQQADVKKILLEEATVRKAKMAEFKAKKEKAEAEKPSKEERLKMTNERLDHQIAMKKKMKATLNPEQFEKYEKMQSKRNAAKKEMSRKRKNRK